ncbi:pantothenate kinase [Diaminobutyricimonas aerilata]|uniref:Pantothenate kinase n=1 Tax=Diaminobutyricimonas aerilata TaxID=1162967 RepID=A0A2M9CNN0_9MICO|nr:nucleoside/nucleotide kinase family protein [Diaminobutyricimonas aerilata]PJJ73499.1 pantothenate kinase [Diaminobutyricimonas aerilata]
MAVIRTIPELLDTVRAVADGRDRTLVGIAGAPGAGKSTIADGLVDELGDGAALLPMDGFHLPQRRLIELGRRDRMGAPDTFDVDGFVATLQAVRDARGEVRAPGFDRRIEEPVADALVYPASTRIVVVEGNYLLHDEGGWERVAPLLDVTFFVSLAHDIRLARLIERHVRFGKTEEAARAWSLGPDETNARLIEGTRERADHVVDLTE